MKTIKNMMMAMTAVVAMMTACVNPANATTNSKISNKTEESSISQETTDAPEVMQYYFINTNNESRRFEYFVDAQGRVTDRIMYGWDNNKQSWFPMTKIHANYGNKTHKLTFATWNSEYKSFCNNIDNQSYDADAYSSLISLPVYSNK